MFERDWGGVARRHPVLGLAMAVFMVGLGGIATGEDAAEFMIAGATAVEVGTANFWDPESPLRIARELDAVLARENVARASDLTGTLKL